MNPAQVVCPNCNAQPGQPCTRPTNTGRVAVTWHHSSREAAAEGVADEIVTPPNHRGRSLAEAIAFWDDWIIPEMRETRTVVNEDSVELVVLITAEQAREWAGYDVDLERLAEAIPHSSIPEAIGVIAQSLNEGAI